MKWPFVSRHMHDAAVRYREAVLSDVLTDLDSAVARIADLECALNIANALKREEQWRRIKAEGLCQYKDDRIRRVLGLPIWPSEEKKTA